MNAPEPIALTIGQPYKGGFYAGKIAVAGIAHALILAPKAEGEHAPAIWIPRDKDLPAAKSYFDGLTNTNAMREAGSKLAAWSCDLRIGGFDDWYLPSQDELELLYRHFKPGTTENWCYERAGINLSALPPTYPYTPEFPVQTSAEAFRAGGVEAFAENWYWSSTRNAANSDYAWCQNFDYGFQDYFSKGIQLRARAVRRIPIK